MAKIFISLSGDGRGHATRMRALVEALREEHEITLFTSGQALEFLGRLYARSRVAVRAIPGLRFCYGAQGELHYPATLLQATRYLLGLSSLVRGLEERILEERPDLAIIDFEPALARAARRRRLPFLLLNHQHFLLTYDLRGLPRGLQYHAAYMGWAVRAYGGGQSATIVSSFYFPPLRAGCRNVTQVGVFLRPEVLATRPVMGDHLTAYFRRPAPDCVLRTLAHCGREVRLYGMGLRPRQGGIRFQPVGEVQFIDDLARCAAVVSTAGNQLVGEALHLGKPVFALPEQGNFEQAINAHFLVQSGCGVSCALDEFQPGRLQAFLGALPTLRSRIDRDRLDGLPPSLEVIRPYLTSPQTRRAVPVPALHEAAASA
jgi:uncharacterized protein (TIGR00661 family)